ncbi:hypothetical protein E3P99_02191 [Wallemia hederae]|uniref:GCF C-terminal domain-containing protein n=1 Tax=Wallemia hederae TaxID=1540922 RepID=A0A4T0FNY0_9BASI|nr:hypothetical protein E3P99_02191 [Wallemia hederae]
MGDEIIFKKRSGKGGGTSRRKDKDEDTTQAPETSVAAAAEGVESSESSTPTLSFKEKQKARRQPRRSNLSFGGAASAEEASETSFKPKKSLISQSISNRLPESVGDGSSTQSYSQSALQDLKASTPTRNDIEISVTDDMDIGEDGYSDIARRIYGTAIEDNKGAIPTPATIDAAKKKRHGGQSIESDYLSLDGRGSGSQALTLAQGTGIESRLQHEDDVFEDDAMGAYTGADESIHLTNQAEKDATRRRRKEQGEMIDEVMDEASDEEQQAWEKAQAKRAMAGKYDEKDEKDDEVYIPAPIPDTTPLPSLNGAIKRLQNLRVENEQQHAEKRKFSEHAQKELVELSQNEAEIKKQVEEVELRRSFFDDLRTWGDELASFLDEKEPELVKIEKRHEEILTERMALLNRRRAGGEVSLDLAPAEQHDYDIAKRGVKDDVKRLFEDVKAPEFKDPSAVLMEKFGEWRKQFGDDYLRAWAPLGMVSVWEFWVRVEMVGWDALRDSNKSIMGLKAYEFCHSYAASKDNDEEHMQTEDEEAKLSMDRECIPHLLSTIIIPHLMTHFSNGGYDAYSVEETQHALDLVDMVEGGLSGLDDEKLEMLIMTLVQVVTSSINEVSSNVNTLAAQTLLRNASSWRRIPASVKQQTEYESNMQQLRELLMGRDESAAPMPKNAEGGSVSPQENERTQRRRLKDLSKSDKSTAKLLKKREKEFKSAEKHLRKAEKAEVKAAKKIDKTTKAQLKANEKKTAAEAKLNKANANSENAKKGLDQAKDTHSRRKTELDNATRQRDSARGERTQVEKELGSVKPTV